MYMKKIRVEIDVPPPRVLLIKLLDATSFLRNKMRDKSSVNKKKKKDFVTRVVRRVKLEHIIIVNISISSSGSV